MPYSSPRVIIQMIDADADDDKLSQWWSGLDNGRVTMSTVLQQRLIAFRFSDHETKKDELTLSLYNADFALIDSPAFVKGQKYLVSWGWPGNMAAPRQMVVVKVKAQNPVEVKLHDTSIFMDRRRRYRMEENITDSEFVRMIAEDNQYIGNLAHIEETTIKRRSITQANRTDARQLAFLAHRNGFIFYVDHTGLHWHRRPTGDKPKYKFIYRIDPTVGSILSEPSISSSVSKVSSSKTMNGRDPEKKEDVSETAYEGKENYTFDNDGVMEGEDAYQTATGRGGIDTDVDVDDGTLVVDDGTVDVEDYGADDDPIITDDAEDDWAGADVGQPVSASKLGNEREVGANPTGKRGQRVARDDVQPAGYVSKEEAAQEANARMLQGVRTRYKCEFKAVGNPKLFAKVLVELENICRMYDGLYYVKELVHDIAAGQYTMDVKLYRDSVKMVPVRKKETNQNPNTAGIEGQNEGSKPNSPGGPLQYRLEVREYEDGSPKASWGYYAGEELVAHTQVTPSRLTIMSDADLRALMEVGVQSELPDAVE